MASLVVCLVIAGCSSSDSEPIVVDARTLLDRYQQERLRHDPRHFSEVELGEYFVTQRKGTASYSIRFHLYAVVADQQRERLQTRLAARLKRIQAAIRRTMQQADPSQLQENTLDWIKSELIRAINGCLEERLVRDVAFADFTFEQV